MIIQIEFTDEQIDTIAALVAEKIGRPKGSLTVPETAERLGVSIVTVRRRVRAGLYPKVPGLACTRIPAAFVDTLLNPNPDA